MKKSISINLQGLLFHVEEDGYEQLRQYLSEVKAHFSNYAGAAEIVADIESRIAELFAARLGADKQVISAEDVAAVTAQLGSVADFDLPEDEDDQPLLAGAAASTGERRTGTDSRQTADHGATAEEPTGPRQLFRDITNKRIAGVAAGLGHYFNTNPLWFRLGFVFLALLNTSWLGNLDDHLHINFGGIGVLAYVILWLVMPKREGLTMPTGSPTFGNGQRKLYRDTEHGSVGGVAAGLAHYFKIDVTLIRVLFVVLFFAGAGFLIYLVLWIVVPEATTLSEKLEMRGEDVTLASIDQSLRSEAPPGAGRARVVQDNLRSVGSTIAPAFKFIFMLVAGFAGFILMVVALAMIVAFGAVLGVVLGVFPANGMHTGDIPVELLRSTAPMWGLVAGFVAFLIPAISLLLLALRLFIRRQFVPATVRLTLLGIWLLSIITLAGFIADFNRNLNERGEVQRTQEFNLAAPVVLLDTQYDDSDLRIDDLNVATADSGQPARLVLRLIARGANAGAARDAAENIIYSAILRDDSVLTIPHEFRLKSGSPWREHELRATLQLPADRRYRLSENFTSLLDEDAYDDRYSQDNLNNKRLFVVEKGYFKLVSGPETKLPKEDDENDHNSDERGDDVHVRIGDLDLSENFRGDFKLAEPSAGAPSRTFRETDFDRVDVSGAYHARLRQGSTFRVVARGNEDDLNDVRVRVNGSTLEIEPKRSVRWFQWHTKHPVVFDIELPTLAGLEVSGASHADVSGFRGTDFEIEQSGASWLRLAMDGSPVKLDVSGASHTLLTGTTPKLTADLSGACELRGRNLKAVDASIDASGASRASVRVSRELNADASGASHITYYGHPTDATTNSSGAGSVRSGDSGNNDEDSADENSDDSNNEDEDGVTLALPAPPSVPAAPALPAAPAAPKAPGW